MVRYGIPAVEDASQHGRARRPMEWAPCSVQAPHGGLFPDGTYFLYTDEGKVVQLKSVNGKWHCLALAA
jgi:hypothetical protein